MRRARILSEKLSRSFAFFFPALVNGILILTAAVVKLVYRYYYVTYA